MKTRNILQMSLLLILFLSSNPSRAHAAQPQNPKRPNLIIRINSIEDEKVVVRVANDGAITSGPCVVRLDIIDPANPTNVLKTMELAVPALEPGISPLHLFTFETAPQKARGNRLQAVIDPSNRVRESNEYDNRALDDSTIVKGGTPSPYATEGGFPKGAPADLVIKAVAGTPSSKSALRVQVANLGDYAVSPPCTLTIDIYSTNAFKNSELVESKDFDVPALKKGETKWLLIEVDKEFELSDNKNQVTPLLPFRLMIDSKMVVEESNKENNKKFFPVPSNYKP